MLRRYFFPKVVPAVLHYKCTGLLLYIGMDLLHFLTSWLLSSYFNQKRTAPEYEPFLSAVSLKYQILQPAPPPRPPPGLYFFCVSWQAVCAFFLAPCSDHIDIPPAKYQIYCITKKTSKKDERCFVIVRDQDDLMCSCTWLRKLPLFPFLAFYSFQ